MSSSRTVVSIEVDAYERLPPRPNRLWTTSRLVTSIGKRAMKYRESELFAYVIAL